MMISRQQRRQWERRVRKDLGRLRCPNHELGVDVERIRILWDPDATKPRFRVFTDAGICCESLRGLVLFVASGIRARAAA